MKPKRFINRLTIYLVAIAAATAICWDIAVATLEVEPGTFRYESEFTAEAVGTTTVGIVTSDYSDLTNPIERSINPSYAQIEEMVGKAIELQGGFKGVIEKGDIVLIKVNLVGGNSPSGNGENTDVRVVKALMRHIHLYTEGDVVMQVAEGTARTNDDPSDPESVWGNSGYMDLLDDPLMDGIAFSLLNLNQSIDNMVEVDLGIEGTSAKRGSKYTVHSAELEADVYIAVPVLKIHNTGITNALKLQIGSAPGCYYGYNKTKGTDLCPTGLDHDVDHRVWTTEEIVDLCNIADIDFVVVDAIGWAPYKIIGGGRNPKNDRVLEAGRVHFTNFSEGVEVVDPFSGKRRLPVKSDLANAAKMVDYLSDIDVCEKAVGSSDVPQEVVPLHNAEAMLLNTSKHCCFGQIKL